MKYIKIIFIFFISLNLSALGAATTTLTEPTLSTDIQNADLTVEANKAETTTVAAPAEENELQNWNNHLKTLPDNWNASTNAPDPSWTARAIEIAVAAIKANKDLIEKLKSEFLDAMNVQSTKFTADTISVVAEFNSAIDKGLGLPEPVAEEATTATTTKEKTSTPETEQAPEAEAVTTTETITPTVSTSSTETTTSTTTENKTEPEKKEEPKKEDEKKEDLLKEWNTCLKDMQSRKGDIDQLIKKATELAQKLHDSKQMDERKLRQDFMAALEGATLARKLPSYYKDDALRDFASALGIYIPTSAMPTERYQPTQSEVTLLTQQGELADMQMEQDERLKNAERKGMVTQAALLEATRKQQLSVDQWQKTQASLTKAEQRRLTQLQEEADQLKEKTKALELKLQKAEQKAASEKSYFTRAKETVSGLIWGPSEVTKPAEELITKEKQQLEKRQEEIAQEQEKLSKEMRCKREQKELRTLKSAEREHDLSKKEIERKAELEAEKRECERIAARNNFERQEKEWPVFMDYIASIKNATDDTNKKLTEEAIAKATSLIDVASRIPSIDILELERMVKTSFANALLNQQRGNENHLNITTNQHKFDRAINNLEQRKAGNRE